MTVMAQPVYSTSTSEAQGHVVEFGVQPCIFRDPRTVLTLPAECMLFGEPGDLRVETRFSQLQDGTIVAQRGTANQHLLDAIKVIASKSILPFDHRVGILATFAGDRVVIVAYLKHDASVKEMCREVANAIFENVADVIVHLARIRSLSVRERKEWLEFQASDD